MSRSVINRYTVVVPARMASSRYPGKPLVKILGLPMIEHVRRRALLASGAATVVVATCDQSIVDAVAAAGGLAVMTADTHERCTDRVAEAMRALDGEVVVMVQGDEPLLRPEAVEAVARPLLDRAEVVCTNLLSPLESDADHANPNIVKAVCAQDGRVMFLSRAPIPFFRTQQDVPVYRQTGIMAFRVSLLRRYSLLPETPFERAEAIDMLRLLEHGLPIHGVVVDYPTIGVDRPEDVPVAEQWLNDNAEQRALFDRIVASSSR
ncbi:MAG: 3-deoxy-manno-octulosonate cytidylyltransferase [Alphaproteobacteria bacterium]|nr:3-deoxy-manno-octulosonate cytidylyltransferase [Alphaproteobacteria bacterium]